MFSRILKDLAVTFTLCLAERVLERALFPGLHRATGRAIHDDPSRIDSVTTLIAETLGVLLWVWLFVGSLYVIGYLIRRPLQPWVPLAVTLVILALVFARSAAVWSTLPMPPS